MDIFWVTLTSSTYKRRHVNEEKSYYYQYSVKKVLQILLVSPYMIFTNDISYQSISSLVFLKFYSVLHELRFV